MEPVVQESAASCATEVAASAAGDADHSGNHWGSVIGGSALTVLPALLGAACLFLALAPPLAGALQGGSALKGGSALVAAFCSGVILAAAVFLLLPEGLHLAGVGQKEVTGTWSWGTAIMLGWLLCVALEHACQLLFGAGESQEEEADAPKGLLQWSLAGPVLFGDLFHNLADGFIIGAAFKSCSPSVAWKIVGITVLHEVPQEIADFFILVTQAGMRWYWAALANFGSGLSTVLGAVVAYSTSVNRNLQGLILAFGGGVYLFVAVTELAPQMLRAATGTDRPSLAASLSRLACFALGAVLIGLVLLDHEHCAPEGEQEEGAGGHAGHGH